MSVAGIGRLQLHYEAAGAGPPLVLLHGALMTAGLLAGYQQRLAGQRRVIAVELQGHGHTRDIDRPLRYELLADDIAALLDQLGLDQADVAGYSMGAGVALQLALRHPAKVRRLVCVSVTFRTDGLQPEMTAGAEPDEVVRQLAGSRYHEAYLAAAPEPGNWPELVRKVLELDARPQHWRPTEIAAIPAPVLLVAADNDVVRLEHTVELYHLLGGGINGDVRGLPAARLAIVPGTTHTGLCDRAAWVVPMITEFLGD